MASQAFTQAAWQGDFSFHSFSTLEEQENEGGRGFSFHSFSTHQENEEELVVRESSLHLPL